MSKIKTNKITVRLTEDDFLTLKKQSYINRISVSALVRQIVFKKLKNEDRNE